MSDCVMELREVSKIYGNAKVVDKVSLILERGHITGLIGPNGAGKTTILKLVAGLAALDEGEILFWGTSEVLEKNRRKMSFMIEEPIIDITMTARNNMKYICCLKGMADIEDRIDKTLKLVGLQDTGRKMVKYFSLGMKQRLAIGMALLSNPEVLILDEPMNGLDPEGVVEVRNLLRRLAEEEKVSILISSHLLSELSEICTDYAIVHHGVLLETSSMQELVKKSKKRIVLRTNNMEKTLNLLKERFPVLNYEIWEEEELFIYDLSEALEEISTLMTQNGIVILKISCKSDSLEQYYLSKVGENCE